MSAFFFQNLMRELDRLLSGALFSAAGAAHRPQQWISPELMRLVQQWGHVQVDIFVGDDQQFYMRVCRVAPDGTRHYASGPATGPPPGGAPPPRSAPRSDTKRRTALKTLGFQVDSTPSPDQIRERYRELAFKCHPDRNPNPRGTERMTRVNMAYQYLKEDWG